jgi:Zn-dependent protease with chaperone function
MRAKELRTSREKALFLISVVFSTVVWLVLLITIIGIVYGALIGLGVLIAHCLLMAHITGNGVRVGPRQLPDLAARIDAAARKLGLEKAPEAYVVQAGGILNAFATKILSRRFIILYSDLIEACEGSAEAGVPNELDFVIGHELGHVAAGHLAFRLFLLPAWILPLVGSAYSRACEYTCDRCGHEVVGNLEVSSRALAILAAGPRTARRVNMDVFVEQRGEAGSFWMAVYELNATHPYLPKRVAALREWLQKGTAAPLGRNVLAYPLAPFFGAMSGNPASALSIVIVFVVLTFAVTIPQLKRQFAGMMGGPAAGRATVGDSRTDGTNPELDQNVERFRKEIEEAAAKQR